jgi:hypothetical protein
MFKMDKKNIVETQTTSAITSLLTETNDDDDDDDDDDVIMVTKDMKIPSNSLLSHLDT